MKKLLETIYRKSLKSFDFQTMEDLLYMSKEAMKTDIPLGVEYLRKLSALCEKTMSNRSLSGEQVIQVYDLHKRVCFAAAKYDFHEYRFLSGFSPVRYRNSAISKALCPFRQAVS